MPTRAMPTLTDPLLTWALWYGEMGLPIFPAHTPTATGACSCLHKATCDSPGKHPRLTGWQKRATTDPDQLHKWWGHMFPDANIALATGHTGWVLDEDSAKGGSLALGALTHAHGPLPDTPLVHSGGGGFHYHFQLPTTGTIGNKVGFAPGLDTRALNGLVILPPSMHASGRPYVWDSDYDLETTPLAPAPDWLLALIQSPQPSSQAPPDPDAPILEPGRNNALSQMAFHMRKAGFSLEGVLAALLAENARCVPPLTPDEIEKIVDGKKDIHPDPVFVFSAPGSNGTDPGGQAPSSWPSGTTWETLRTTRYPTHTWHIKGLMRHGMTFIGGAPKAAKSYIAYDIGLATVEQGLALGYWGCTPGGVLYCAVEDDEADSKDRVFELRPKIPDTLAHPLIFVNMDDVPSFSRGLYDYVRHMVETHGLSLVIIDPFLYVYDLPVPRGEGTVSGVAGRLAALSAIGDRSALFAHLC